MALLRALGVALCGCWAFFLAAFVWLPPRLNALLNALAATSPLSAPYYAPAAAADAAQGQLPSRAQEGEQQRADGVLQAPVDEQAREPNGAAAADAAGAAAAAAVGKEPQAAKEQQAGGSDVDSGTDDTRLAPDQDHHRDGHGQEQEQQQQRRQGDTRTSAAAASVLAPAASAAPLAPPAAAPPVIMRLHRRELWRTTTRGSAAAAHSDTAANDADNRGGSKDSGGGGQQGSRLVMSLEECRRRYGGVPSMDVVIMVAGTRGDVQPATALGAHLAAEGHRVRLATHVPYRELVEGAHPGLEFYPLAGDPKGMMELTVKHKGMLFSDLRDLAWLRGQYRAIMDSCWQAATAEYRPRGGGEEGASGRGGGGGRRFKPDLVIGTAITYGAVHCAEALGAACHVISTIPWRPTKSICHPWARGFDDTLAGHCAALAAALLPLPPAAWAKASPAWMAYGKFAAAARTRVCEAACWWSSALLDHTAWLGIADLVLRFRRRLGLHLASRRSTGFALYDVPSTFTFSPALVPRPPDWGSHVCVSGPLLLPLQLAEAQQAAAEGVDDTAGSSSHSGSQGAGGGGGGGGGGFSSYVPPSDLVAFLEAEPDRPPVYIGFGSMTVAEGRYVAAAIRTAVADCGVRAVVSAGGWGCIARVDEDGGAAGQQEQQGGGVGSGGKGSTSSGSSRDIFVVQDVPHEWLFPRCSAVVHHGGVGTTAAGLLAGCPTFVAPSFGDLYFWGELCARAGVGPAPVPIHHLNADNLAAAIRALQGDEVRAAAKRAGSRLREGSGVARCVEHIYRGLQAEVVLG